VTAGRTRAGGFRWEQGRDGKAEQQSERGRENRLQGKQRRDAAQQINQLKTTQLKKIVLYHTILFFVCIFNDVFFNFFDLITTLACWFTIVYHQLTAMNRFS
jgi:hypothetical protein